MRKFDDKSTCRVKGNFICELTQPLLDKEQNNEVKIRASVSDPEILLKCLPFFRPFLEYIDLSQLSTICRLLYNGRREVNQIITLSIPLSRHYCLLMKNKKTTVTLLELINGNSQQLLQSMEDSCTHQRPYHFTTTFCFLLALGCALGLFIPAIANNDQNFPGWRSALACYASFVALIVLRCCYKDKVPCEIIRSEFHLNRIRKTQGLFTKLSQPHRIPDKDPARIELQKRNLLPQLSA